MCTAVAGAAVHSLVPRPRMCIMYMYVYTCTLKLAYADDFRLLAPSPSALRKMLCICEQFG